jgi:hypothetical protein
MLKAEGEKQKLRKETAEMGQREPEDRGQRTEDGGRWAVISDQ